MKLSDVLLESDVYNQNPQLKNSLENVIPQLHKAAMQKIASDRYSEAAQILEKMKMVLNQCSEQIKVFAAKSQSPNGTPKISNEEL
jgi:hypothetical protein